MRAQGTHDSAIFELFKPPCEICQHGVGWVPCCKFIVVEGGGEIGQGGQAGAAVKVNKGDMAKGAMNFFNIK